MKKGENYDELMRKFYWEEKDVGSSVFIGKAGIVFCIHQSLQRKENKGKFLSKAKTMAYNIASFTWNGWDEQGIQITECELKEGFEAAKLNLRLAVELNKPPSALHNAHWMLGAHYISRGDYDKAIEHFQIKLEGIDKTAELLSDGFTELTKYLKNKQTDREFLEVVQVLNEIDTDDSKMYAQQMLIARKVFENKSG